MQLNSFFRKRLGLRVKSNLSKEFSSLLSNGTEHITSHSNVEDIYFDLIQDGLLFGGNSPLISQI